ncbi:ketopantoate reductase family protein [Pseudomonas chlororaphis]|uniref:ketopantoate reductase family protein n=1 Tax=Pseudomonas chlororaphis TaxID=587753 RepID=UPI0003D3A87D|nr:2-dehydropantoate 2-reductase [Pseudomonas chlororaphis]AZD29273.1 2-dehydropantoate 2-reductase [Pseudomonas chlororaphis]ETD37882.1 2-dehydropantoate 2-reductase [Pseudomonas chlororaphis subsp. aurantiaca PB-St2]QFS54778.1 2-dehydropantoate 2-reductase [Pseudomonas chlororaphis subsp. aurantiaca]
MNISILGAGAMGSLFGGLLAQSGQQVTLLDINDAYLEAIRRQGLRLETDSGDRRIGGLSACRPEQVTGQPDLLLVFTKAQHTDSALRSIAGHIGEHTRVLTLQNGLGNAEALCRHVAPQRVMIGMTTWPADMAGPGHVRSHGQGVVRLMSLEGVERQASNQVAAVLEAAGLQCAVDPQVWTSIWEKVAFNAALNSLCAVTGCTVGQLDAAPEGVALARAIVLEVLGVAQSLGVATDAQRCLETVAYAIAHHRTHKPSMLQDVLAGRPTEIGAINGEVLARARQAGIAVPHTETLLGLLRLIEARAAAGGGHE